MAVPAMLFGQSTCGSDSCWTSMLLTCYQSWLLVYCSIMQRGNNTICRQHPPVAPFVVVCRSSGKRGLTATSAMGL